MTSAPSPNKGGFTLVEILAVMGMLALLFTIVVFSMGGSGDGQNMRIAATELRSALRFARQHAIANSTTCSVIFAYDPERAQDKGTFKRNQLYAEAGSNPRATTRDRYLRSYAVYSKRAELGGSGLITSWKSLPQGLVFDTDQKFKNTITGYMNVLNNPYCRTSVLLFAYSEDNKSTTDDKTFGLVQAITFRADGTVKLNGIDAGAGRPTIFIAEGATNAADDIKSALTVTYREPRADARKYVSLYVPVFSGDAFMSTNEQLKVN